MFDYDSPDSEVDEAKAASEVPENYFSNLMTQAMNLKSAQLSTIRNGFDSSPGFIRATEVFASRNDNWQKYDENQLLEHASSVKEEGNKLYSEKHLSKALNKYSESISHFYFFKRMDSKGERLQLFDRINGNLTIQDRKKFKVNTSSNAMDNKNTSDINNEVAYCDLIWKSPQTKKKSKMLLIQCLLNCALISVKMRNHNDVVYCCKLVLKMDPTNAKACYRMAESYEILDTTTDLESAYKYISQAKLYCGPDNKIIHAKYRVIKKKLKRQNRKDKQQFKGLFERGEIYDDCEEKPEQQLQTNSVRKRCEQVMDMMSAPARMCTIL